MPCKTLQGFFVVRVLVDLEALFLQKIWFLPSGSRNNPLCTREPNEQEGEWRLCGTELCQNQPQRKSPAQKGTGCFDE